jgi:hypothetical protein
VNGRVTADLTNGDVGRRRDRRSGRDERAQPAAEARVVVRGRGRFGSACRGARGRERVDDPPAVALSCGAEDPRWSANSTAS